MNHERRAATAFTIHDLTPPRAGRRLAATSIVSKLNEDLNMETVKLLSRAELEAGLDIIRQTPKDAGKLTLIVRRPAVDVRETLDEAWLDPACGLVGDSWPSRSSSRMPDGAAHPEMQLTVMNTRAIALIAPDVTRWPLAGDQLFIEIDLSAANLPPGTRLVISRR